MARRKNAVKNRSRTPPCGNRPATRPGEASQPKWDRKTGKLFYDGVSILEISHQGCNQWRLIEAFDQAGWPEHLDDPLSEPEQRWHSSERLNQTVKDLNRKLKGKRLHFRVDADRLSVRWEVVKKQR